MVVFLENNQKGLVLSRKNIMVKVFLFKTDVVVFLQNNQKDLVLSSRVSQNDMKFEISCAR